MSESYPDLLVWTDLETTGLSSEADLILEIGFLITDAQLRRLDSRSWVIWQPPQVLGLMDDWCSRQHGQSGLIAACASAPRESYRTAPAAARDFLDALPVDKGTVPMAGASVHFDRAFLRKQAPEIEEWFYYGNLDVSSVEKVARLWYPDLPKWEDRGLHRVDPDNEDAVAELAYYRQHIFVPVDGART